MNELLVMRHAKSDWSSGERDFDRPLNARGARAADQMAAWLLASGLCPDRVVSSPAARTRATALAIVSECGTDKRELEFEPDGYLADAFTWRQLLAQQPQGRILICGHNPGLDDLVDELSGRSAPLSESGKLMTTAAIAHFRVVSEWAAIDERSCDLVQLVRPKELS